MHLNSFREKRVYRII
uniref:Uncharacterized protein n=1 Tax=Anguilla anguilla TaxID=7936 RepID=A0A0E9UDR0_ANGAN